VVANGAAEVRELVGPGYFSEFVVALDPAATAGDLVIEGGSVLVTAELSSGATIGARKARWRYRGYAVSNDSIVLHPNIYLRANETLRLIVQLRARNDVISSTLSVNASVSARVSMKPVPGAERDAHPYGRRIDGTGTRRLITGADPAAGSEVTVAAPTGVEWRVISASVELVTAAGGGSRLPRLQHRTDSDALIARYAQGASQGGSLTGRHTWGSVLAHGGDIGTFSQAISGIADIRMLGGYDLTASTVNLAGTDNYGAMTLEVEEWITAQEAAS